MWKRDDAVAGQPHSGGGAFAGGQYDRLENSNVNIGKSVVIKGELSGSEDLTIEGQVEGKIELRQNILTIGPNARIKAEVVAKIIVVEGEVNGNITAIEKIDIRDAGSVDGDLTAPRIAIADGAQFRGSIDMKREAVKAESKPTEAKPASQGQSPMQSVGPTVPSGQR